MSYNRRPGFRERLIRFMSGRNGKDKLGSFIFGSCLVLVILNLFLELAAITIIETLLLIYGIFRFMSRNIYKRQEENRKFCKFFSSIKGFFTLTKNKFRDRKTHVYRKCPKCKSNLRLPKSKGEHTVRCPRCTERFDVKIR